MRKIYPLLIFLLFSVNIIAQEDSSKPKELDAVIITGQYKPQSVKNSVYQVRVINNERIRLSGASTVQQVLSTQLGFRFSSDRALGVSDVQLMGMSGRNVKILLDGISMTDRGDTRESLNQIDINTIERIEVIEGPMSVSYGSDALAGVINLITKKNNKEHLSVSARVQEETAGNEYHPFNYKGVHFQNIAAAYKKGSFEISGGGTHNEFDGFGGDAYGRDKEWKPKEHWMGNVKFGYNKNGFNIYYRLDALREDISSRGAINQQTYKAIDQHFKTNRYFHQVQGGYNFNSNLQLSTALAYTDYQRRTRTTKHDFEKNTDELTSGAGEQDLSKFNSFVFRNTLQYRLSNRISIQPGIDINREEASGERIAGNPVITDYALFVSSEIKATASISVRPGLRFIKNSVYDAPPVIPSLNAKVNLNKNLDLRFAYAHGFRSPALRELYFDFVDANHNIVGNPDLKAEYSNSFNGSLHLVPKVIKETVYTGSFETFYNEFNNLIDFALASATSNQYTYFNVNKAKTTGFILENKISRKKLDATLGLSYIGYSRRLYDDQHYIKEDTKDFLWSPEINSSVGYTISPIKTKLSVFYKYTGKKPQYVTGKNAANQDVLFIASTSGYHLADLTTYTNLNKFIAVTAGVKNLFNVERVNNSAVSSGSIHSSAGPVAIAYGRSYFIGLNFQWNKN